MEQLVPAPVTGRQMGGLSLLRTGREGASGEPGRDAAAALGEGRQDRSARKALRRPGHHQRAVGVAGQRQAVVRELLIGAVTRPAAYFINWVLNSANWSLKKSTDLGVVVTVESKFTSVTRVR